MQFLVFLMVFEFFWWFFWSFCVCVFCGFWICGFWSFFGVVLWSLDVFLKGNGEVGFGFYRFRWFLKLNEVGLLVLGCVFAYGLSTVFVFFNGGFSV